MYSKIRETFLAVFPQLAMLPTRYTGLDVMVEELTWVFVEEEPLRLLAMLTIGIPENTA